MDLGLFTQAASKAVTAVPRYPFVERDIAVVVEASLPWASIEKETEKAAGELLKSVAPFDVFSGGSLPEGRKSVAFRLRLQDPGKTLSEADINSAVDRIKAALQKNCGAQLR
jgi:phenylalanyl-tRNA synthetase beta chain